MDAHLCTCHGCEIAPYQDRCRFEEQVRALQAAMRSCGCLPCTIYLAATFEETP